VVEFKASALIALPYDRRIYVDELRDLDPPTSEASA
jgi:hypothetical protein